MPNTFELKNNIIEIRSGGALKFTTNRLLSSIVFRQSGTINVTDYSFQAPIIIKEHPAIVDDPQKYFMFISYNIFGGDINSEFESVNGMGSVLLGVYKDIDGFFAGSIILDFISEPGILKAKISKNVKDGAKIDWSGTNHSSAPSILIQYAVQYCRFASNLVPTPIPEEPFTANCLLVGGGGGGGGGTLGMVAGGGGAGEVKEFTTVIQLNRSYNIYVGKAGKGGKDIYTEANGERGQTTRFYSYTALGGAGGSPGNVGGHYPGQGGFGAFGSGSGASGSDQEWFKTNLTNTGTIVGDYYSRKKFRIDTITPIIDSDDPIPGGVAGGSVNRQYTPSALVTNPTLPVGLVNAGGSGVWYNAGGGGGAGSAGGNGLLPSNSSRDDPVTNVGGVGGLGYTSSITGTPTKYAAGGGGGTVGATPTISADGVGGIGGSSTAKPGLNAIGANTGSGGGGKGCQPGELIKPITITGNVTGNGVTLSGATVNLPHTFFSNVYSTSFTTDLSVGDKIFVDGQTRTIAGITDNNIATVDKPFNPAFTQGTAAINLTRSAGSIGGDGSDGIIVLKLPTPYIATFSEGVIYQHISAGGYNIYKITETQTEYERVKIRK